MSGAEESEATTLDGAVGAEPAGRLERLREYLSAAAVGWEYKALAAGTLAMLGVVAWLTTQDKDSWIDWLFVASFAIFAGGFGVLFLYFVYQVIVGKISIHTALLEHTRAPKDGEVRISFSRLQAFLWTLVILVVYFHRAVQSHELPTLPPELLAVMGISAATYLGSKQITKAQTATAPASPAANRDDESS